MLPLMTVISRPLTPTIADVVIFSSFLLPNSWLRSGQSPQTAIPQTSGGAYLFRLGSFSVLSLGLHSETSLDESICSHHVGHEQVFTCFGKADVIQGDDHRHIPHAPVSDVPTRFPVFVDVTRKKPRCQHRSTRTRNHQPILPRTGSKIDLLFSHGAQPGSQPPSWRPSSRGAP